MNAKDIAGVYATAQTIHSASDAAFARLDSVDGSDHEYAALAADIRSIYADFKDLADDLVSGVDQLAKHAPRE